MDTRPALRHRTPAVSPTARTAVAARTACYRHAEAHGQRIARATRHLIALGHLQILLVTAQQRSVAEADAELQAHCQVMLAAGLPLLPRLELDTAAALDWPEWQSALEAVAPTALLCTRAALVPPLEAALRSQGRLSQLIVVGPDNGVATAVATHH